VDPTALERVAIQAARELADGTLKRSARKPGVMEWLLERNPLGRSVLFSQARKAVAKASGGHYPAPFGILDSVRTGIEQGMPAGLDYEATRFGNLGFTSESAALRGLFFAQTATKKNPYKAEDAPGRKVDTVGVLGAGLMGAGIAHVTAVAGECGGPGEGKVGGRRDYPHTPRLSMHLFLTAPILPSSCPPYSPLQACAW
jgi:hypothetical protein